MSNTDRDSMLERWADGMERLEQYYEGIYGPPATPPSLPPITTRDAMLEAIADGMERAKRNINKKSPTYHSDSVAYVKTVPAGNVHYASLEQIGGKTVVWNQLEPNPTTVYSVSGSHALNAGTQIIAGHKYYMSCTASGTLGNFTGAALYKREGTSNVSIIAADRAHGYADIVTSNYSATSNGTTYLDEGNCWTYVYLNGADSITNIQLIDLTLLYGAGNEPSTVAEFQQTFPAVWYAYNKGQLLSAGVTSVISKKADTTEIATYPIPAEIRNLEGYGWSAGTVFNYIDYEAKKFVKRVASVDLSTLTWGYGPSVGWSATLNAKNPADDDTVFNAISATLTPVTRNAQATAFSGGTDAGMVSVSGGKVYVGTGDIGIVPSGTLYYELDEPVETDISAYLADDGLIEVEVGGTLEFPNQNGVDYRIPVPSSETFVVGEP